MNYTKLIFFVISIAATLVPLLSKAQSRRVVGYVKEARSNLSIPFAQVQLSDSVTLLADIEGKFQCKIQNRPGKFFVSSYLYRSEFLETTSDTIVIRLEKNSHFVSLQNNDAKGKSVMAEIIAYKSTLDLHRVPQHSFLVYNKFWIAAANPEKADLYFTKPLIAKTLHLPPFLPMQHVVLAESITEHKFYDRLHHTEMVKAVMSSSVTIPSLFVRTSHDNHFSLYLPFINVNGKAYVSPLDMNQKDKYVFQLLKKLKIGQDSIAILQFNPAPKTSFESLQGWLYIDLGQHAVVHYAVLPAQEGAEQYFYGTDSLCDNRAMVPTRKKHMLVNRQGMDVRYSTISDSYFSDFDLTNGLLQKSQFDEAVWKYTHESEQPNSSLWDAARALPLTKADSQTYKYYADWKQKKFLQRTLSLGESFTLGFIPIGKVNMETRRLLHLNDIEGLRLGVGLQTNEKFSEIKRIGVYAGYGFKDHRWKYGANYEYQLFRHKSLWHSLTFDHELAEAGAPGFYFDRPQYPSETIRKFRLKILDMVSRFETRLFAHPLKYLDASVGYSYEYHTLNYSYSLVNQLNAGYNFAELKAGVRFAFGEQVTRFLNYQQTVAAPYPIVYFQLTKGVPALGSQFNYIKTDVKLEYEFRIPRLGATSLQVIGGLVNGRVPYTKLYNMRGAYRSPSVVIRNSFETMRYNEFLSDRYLSFFIIHKLGRIYVNHPNIQPVLLILHNFGFGSLARPDLHTGLPFQFKTMEKGFIETGFFTDNLLVFKVGGIRTGWGFGFFYRYGAQASLKGSDNLVWKFSTNYGF